MPIKRTCSGAGCEKKGGGGKGRKEGVLERGGAREFGNEFGMILRGLTSISGTNEAVFVPSAPLHPSQRGKGDALEAVFHFLARIR